MRHPERSPKRVKQLERTIHRLRNHPLLWDDNKGDQVTRCISLAKKLCSPAWSERYRQRMEEKLNSWLLIQ